MSKRLSACIFRFKITWTIVVSATSTKAPLIYGVLFQETTGFAGKKLTSRTWENFRKTDFFGGVGGLCLCKVVKWEEVCLRDIKLGWEAKSVFMHYNEKRKRKEVFCGGEKNRESVLTAEKRCLERL